MSLKPVCGLNWLERWALHKVLEEKKYYFRTSLTSISSPLLPTCMSLTLGPFSFTHGVLSQSLVSDSLKPHGLQPSRLLCPWGFSRQEYQSGLPCPPSGDLPNPGIKPRSGSSISQQTFSLLHSLSKLYISYISLCISPLTFMKGLSHVCLFMRLFHCMI